MKRRIALLIVAAVVVGGGALAWAEAGPSRPSDSRDSASDLAGFAETAQSSAGSQSQKRGALRQAMQQCRQQAGIAQPQPGTRPTPPTAAQRQQVLDCLAKAGFSMPQYRRGFGRDGGPRAFLGRAIHGELIVPDTNGTFRTVVFDRGTEDGDVNHTLTITRSDKAKVTVQLTGSTKYAGVADESQLQAGRETVVVADKDGKAILVGQRNPAAPRGDKNRVTS